MAVRGLRSRRRARRGHAHADPDRQAQRCRSAGLACRRAGADRRSQGQRLGRAVAMELAPRYRRRARRLSRMAAPASAVTISRAAEILGEDEELLWDMATDMEPEDARLWIYGTDDQQTVAFTADGMEYLRELLPEYK